jgi:hypothetical protein
MYHDRVLMVACPESNLAHFCLIRQGDVSEPTKRGMWSWYLERLFSSDCRDRGLLVMCRHTLFVSLVSLIGEPGCGTRSAHGAVSIEGSLRAIKYTVASRLLFRQ